MSDGPAPTLLPPLLTPTRRRWLVFLVLNGLARAVMAALAVLALRASLAAGAAPHIGALGLLAMALLGAALAWLQRREMLDAEALAQHYIAHVRLRLFDKLARLTPEQAQRRSRGAVLLRFVGDVQALRNWIGRGMARGLVAGASLLALWGVLMTQSSALGLAVALLLLGGALAARRLWGPMHESTAAARRQQAHIAAYMQDRIAGLGSLQILGRAAAERARLGQLNAKLRQGLQCRADWRGRHRALTSLLSTGLLMALAANTLYALSTTPTLKVGGLGALAASSLLLMFMLPAVRTLGQVADEWVAAQVARDRLQLFLSDGAPPPAGTSRVALRPTLTLQRPAWAGRVTGPEATLPYGSRVALLGPTTSGKSSLLALIAGLQQASSGAVLLDGQALQEFSPASLRQRIALLSPDMPLLRGSVAQNVAAHQCAPSAEALASALQHSGLAELLGSLPKGLDSRVQDAGANLSHGQRSAILLARSLAAQPALLLIDNPAACLPGPVEASLARLLSHFHGTVIFTTCEPGLARLADLSWVLQAGQVHSLQCHPRPADSAAELIH